jgi:hypothetical protein
MAVDSSLAAAVEGGKKAGRWRLGLRVRVEQICDSYVAVVYIYTT